MSTNSIVALAAGDGFIDGVYIHWDGNPSWRGPELLRLAEAQGSFGALWDKLKGNSWSSLNDGATNTDEGLFERVPGIGLRHTDVTEDDLAYFTSFSWHGGPFREAEWAYVLNPDTETLSVLDLHASAPVLLATVRLDSKPDWVRIECGENFERCSHYASTHFEVPKEAGKLGTQTWLGRKPLTLEDAIGFWYCGTEYRRTGSGHRQRLYGGGYGEKWYESVKRPDGFRFDLHVWTYHKTVPTKLAPGVIPIYPPIASEVLTNG